MKIAQRLALILLSCQIITACVQTRAPGKPTSKALTLPVGKKDRYTKAELDELFKLEAHLIFGDKETSSPKLCCTLLPSEIRAIEIASLDFVERTVGDRDDYGVVVRVGREFFVIDFLSLYQEAMQAQIGGLWFPENGESELGQYRYWINRSTLAIERFESVPQ